MARISWGPSGPPQPPHDALNLRCNRLQQLRPAKCCYEHAGGQVVGKQAQRLAARDGRHAARVCLGVAADLQLVAAQLKRGGCCAWLLLYCCCCCCAVYTRRCCRWCSMGTTIMEERPELLPTGCQSAFTLQLTQQHAEASLHCLAVGYECIAI